MTTQIKYTTKPYISTIQDESLAQEAVDIFSTNCKRCSYSHMGKVSEDLKETSFICKTFAIASGVFGQIYVVERKEEPGSAYILKWNHGLTHQDPSKHDGELKKYGKKFQEEGELLKELTQESSCNIPKFSEFLPSPQNGYIMECCYTDFDKLRNRLRSKQLGFSLQQIQKMMRDVLMGLKHMHALGIVNLDIKPANLLVAANNILKIGDFSEARRVFSSSGEKKELPHLEIVTLWYRSPRILTYKPDGLDEWSAGLCFIEMFTLTPFLRVTYCKSDGDELSTMHQISNLITMVFTKIRSPSAQFSKAIQWDKLKEKYGNTVCNNGCESREMGDVKWIKDILDQYKDLGIKESDAVNQVIKLSRERFSIESEKQDSSLEPFTQVIYSLLNYENPPTCEKVLTHGLFSLNLSSENAESRLESEKL